ncbi:MAG TPA: hypothetical protein VHD84_00300 [Candidatus Saccharimonadales bacterium]|nr:hypothetical protein [Candidatus Saccharimonadales bacterium]
MEDALQTAVAVFSPGDLDQMRRIAELRQPYIDACDRLVEAEADVVEASYKLEDAVYPNAERQPERPAPGERRAETLQHYSSLCDTFGRFALETQADGFVYCWNLELEFDVVIARSDDTRVLGKHTMKWDSHRLDTGKNVLYWTNEDDPGVESPFSFAVSVDPKEAREQLVALAICEGGHDAAVDAISRYITPEDSGRADA